MDKDYELEALPRCPTCGSVIKVLEDVRGDIAICSHCGNEYFIKHAQELGKIEIDKTKDLASLRQLLAKAISKNNIRAIRESSNKILEIIPKDYSAQYFFAYADKQGGNPSYYKDFLLSSEEEATPQEKKVVLKHLIDYCDLRDRYDIEVYLKKVKGINTDNYINYLRAIVTKKKEEEENFEVLNRDVFICHRSKDSEIAGKVVTVLEQDGYKCWISSRNLRPNDSDNYWRNIEDNIGACKIFLVVSSEGAMESNDVKEEIRLAKKYYKPMVELKIDQTEHNTFFKENFDGLKWVECYDNLASSESILCKRIYTEIEKLKEVETSQSAPNYDIEKAIEKAIRENRNVSSESQGRGDCIEAEIERADTFYYKIKDFEKTREIYKDLSNKFPNDYRSWLGMVKILTNNYTDGKNQDYVNYLNRALAVANEKQKSIIIKAIEPVKEWERERNRRIRMEWEEAERRRIEAEEEAEAERRRIEAEQRRIEAEEEAENLKRAKKGKALGIIPNVYVFLCMVSMWLAFAIYTPRIWIVFVIGVVEIIVYQILIFILSRILSGYPKKHSGILSSILICISIAILVVCGLHIEDVLTRLCLVKELVSQGGSVAFLKPFYWVVLVASFLVVAYVGGTHHKSMEMAVLLPLIMHVNFMLWVLLWVQFADSLIEYFSEDPAGLLLFLPNLIFLVAASYLTPSNYFRKDENVYSQTDD